MKIRKILSFLAALSAPLLISGQSPGGVAANLRVWLKPDSGFTPASWQDNSGNANNYTQTNPARQPFVASTQYNFNPVIDFGGATSADGRFMAYPSGGPFTANGLSGTFFTLTLTRTGGTSGYRDIWGFNGTTTTANLTQADVPTVTKLNDNIVLFNTTTSAFPNQYPDNQFLLSDISYTVNVAGIKYGLNGVNGTSNQTRNTAASSQANGSILGSQPEVMNGVMGDMIAYERDLTEAEKIRVRTYSSIKYGITLPHNYVSASSQVIWDNGANAGYNNNIAGIARDNLSALHQKQSRSINSEQKLIIGVGNSLFNSNALNTNSLTDGQSLIWGDNGLQQSLNVPIAGITGVNYRFASIWKAQNTGNVGTVRIAWPAGLTNLRLVQSTDPTFATGNTVTDMSVNTQTVNGITYNYADVTLSDGYFFTFAAYMQSPGGVGIPAVWLRANDGTNTTTTGSNVTSWTNYGLAGGTAVQAYAGAPTFQNGVHNFNPSVTDNTLSVHDGLVLANVFPDYSHRDLNTFVLQSQPNLAQQLTMVSFGNNVVPGSSLDSPWFATQSATQSYFFWQDNYQATPTYPNSLSRFSNIPTINSYYIPRWVSGSHTTTLSLNGALSTASGGVNTNRGIGNHLFIHEDGGTNNNSGGNISEVISFDRPLTDTEKLQVNTYLAVKYGITLTNSLGTLPTDYLNRTAAVVWNSTTNNGYNNNIAGIARDDDGALNQKQSWSVNTGKQVLISTTGLGETNAANGVSLTNGQYLIWGDNGLKRSPSVVISGVSGVNYRFASIWKAQNTGNVGTVRIAWPSGLSSMKLIQNTDPTFATGNTVTDMSVNTQTVNGITYNYADVTLANGQYFTFAAYVHAPGGVLASLWYRADKALVPAAGAVSTWTDYSYNQAAVTPALANTTSSPSAVDGIGLNFNFNPAVTFAAANALGNTSLLNSTTGPNYTIYTQTTSGTGDRIVGLNYSAFTGGAIYDNPGIGVATVGLRNSGSSTIMSYTPTDFTYRYTNFTNTTIARNTFTNTSFARALNGGTTGATSTFSNTAIGADGGIIFGRNANQGGDDGGAAITIGETIIFDGALSANDINRVDSYLAIKGGITLDVANTPNYLSSNSTNVWNSTSNAGYNNNIFGIANDFVSALNQKQSRSINSNQKLIIGAGGTLANTNALNANTLTDGQFLIVGDNGLRQGPSVPISGIAGVNYRFASIWKAQNTGSVGTVRIAWPAGLNNMRLVQNSDPTFAAGNTVTDMSVNTQTVNGVTYNYADVTVANGQYFTFAAFANAPGGVVNGLSQWYRADKNALNTGNNTDVTSWTEFFQGIVATQKGTNALPKFRIGAVDYFNFNPGINFTVGTQTIGNNAVRTLTSLDYDVFTLTKEGMVAGGGNPRYFSIAQDNSNTSNDAIMDAFGLAPTGTVERRPIGAGTQYPGINPAFATAIPSIMYHKLTNTTAAKGLNGGALGATATYNPQGEQLGGHFFGDTQFSGNGSDNRGFVGNIGETIVYGAGTLTDAERRKVDTYLAIKYGLTLGRVATDNYISSADAAIWNGALNTTYNNNVFGLAKDDISELHQKVSVSVSAGPVLIMATNNDFVSQNADASRTSLTGDQKYFLAGDNAVTTTSLVNITAGANPGRRIQKVWLSQRTNTLGNIYFAADLAAYGTGFASTGAVRMFVADDAAFTVNVQSVTGTFSSGKWVFNKSFDSDASARYFTFGIEILPPPHAPGGVFTGIARWYRADRDATLVTGRVSTLLDQVSDTETITQPTATRRPLYNSTTNLINFNPNMVFTPNPHIGLNSLTGGYAAGTEGITSFSVAVPTAATLGQRKYIFGITNVSQSGDAAVDNAKRIAVGNVDCGNSAIPNIGKFRNCDRYVNTGAWTAGIPSIIKAGSRPAPNNISFFISQNGNTTATANGSIAMNYSEAGFGLGSGGDNEVDVNVYGWNGQISEVILYGGELSETDQRRVDSYLAIKHGITLARVATNNYLGSTASSSSVIWDGALNTTYNNNVFGIARADIGDFHQKVSKSINAGTILTIAKDNDFVSSNISASRTGLTSNESYLLVGDNTVTATPLVSFTVAGTNAQRIQRIWLSQRTSTTGNIYLEADLSAYGTTFAAGNNIRMFVADDAAFTVNVQSVQGSFSGGKWVFSKSFDTDATARYITFGSEPQPQVLWLKADKGVNTFTGVPAADNTQLTTWFDQLIVDGGQNGVPATIHPSTPAETNLPTMPYYRYNATDNFNFNPVVNFDAAGNGQSVQMLTPTKASQTIISVFKSPGITGQNTFYGSGLLYGGDALNSNPTDGDAVPKSDLSFAVRSQSRLIAGGGSSGDFTFSGNVLLNNLPSIGTLRRDRISDENVSLSMYSNGTVEVSPQNVDPTNGATGEGRDLINAVRIGKTFTAYENGVGSPIGKLNGAVAETIVYDRVLTDAERARVETYLAVKYGITLTGGTQQSGVTGGNVNYPYVNSSGAVVRASDTTYLYDVFGLGRDDFYGLNQRISKSNNPGDILTVSTNTDFTSLNLDATRTEINGDKEFMLFANNRGGLNPVTQQTTELPANVQRRLDREWKVAQANTDGTNIPSVSLKFNMAGVTLTGATGLNLMLLVDSDGDGNFTTGTVQQIPASSFTAGTEALFNNVALANGQVFTLGIAQDVCYKPGAVASAGNPVLPTKAGVTALGRAGSGDADNWPMVRNGGWLALESKTKGFVLNKVAFTDADSNPSTPDVPVGIAPANFIEGMMVYDTTNSCLKIYTSINNGTSYEWRCMNTQTCPD